MKHYLKTTLVLVLGCIVGLGAATLVPGVDRSVSAVVAAEFDQSDADVSFLEAENLSQSFQHVADRLRPSVVSISSVKRYQTIARGPRQFGPQMRGFPKEFRRFFGEDFFRPFEDLQIPGREFEQRGLGTGVIVSADGYIVTNNHVVGDADELTVTLYNDEEYEATVVGTDEQTDLAVLKIDADGLTPAVLGDSENLRIGEWVLAIGSPFGLKQTVTAGIVSAVGRSDVGITDYEDFIQTDAAINPGNSGGPLVNLRGEVVGINTAIATQSGGYMGVGFAIPSNMVGQIQESLIEHGRVDRGRLGVVIQNLTDDLAESFGFDGEGVLIGDVLNDSPAEEAGLQSGDIITAINGRPVRSMHVMRNVVAATAPGTDLEIEVFRNGSQQTLTAKVDRLDTSASVAANAEEFQVLGLTVQNLSPEFREEFGYASDQPGIVVVDVEPGTPAADLGLQPDDLIVLLNEQEIGNVGQFRDMLEELDLADGVRLVVKRGDFQRFVVLKSSSR